MCKKIKFGADNKTFDKTKINLHRPQIYVKKLSKNFDTPKYVFVAEGAYAPRG
jgi:hypothetical protein